MRNVVWLDTALENFLVITEFIAGRDPLAAHRLVDRLLEDADALGLLPAQYRRGRVAGTHGLVSHPNYILVYRYTITDIEVLSVLHARQRYPK